MVLTTSLEYSGYICIQDQGRINYLMLVSDDLWMRDQSSVFCAVCPGETRSHEKMATQVTRTRDTGAWKLSHK